MEELKKHIGQTYNYLGDKITIRNIKKVSGNYVFLTDGRTYVNTESELPEFLENLKPYIKMEKQLKLTTVSPESLEIKDILFKAIKSVQRDRGYVAQANAICNITSQLINIKKLELMIKESNK